MTIQVHPLISRPMEPPAGCSKRSFHPAIVPCQRLIRGVFGAVGHPRCPRVSTSSPQTHTHRSGKRTELAPFPKPSFRRSAHRGSIPDKT